MYPQLSCCELRPGEVHNNSIAEIPMDDHMAVVGLLNLHLYLPGCTSLKEKRSRIKPLLARLHKEFNVSVAEIEHQDAWQEAVLGCALVSNEAAQTQRALQVIPGWIENNWHDVSLVDDSIELL
jgi:uncharacterized protein YlxP (DUF503 family)